MTGVRAVFGDALDHVVVDVTELVADRGSDAAGADQAGLVGIRMRTSMSCEPSLTATPASLAVRLVVNQRLHSALGAT